MRKLKVRGLSGRKDPTPLPYEIAHAALAREAASEGIVLLKNENHVLPLQAGAKIALFGAGATHTIKGGTGSGDVNERASVTIAQGMENAGFQLTTKAWMEAYDKIYEEGRQAWKDRILRLVAQKMAEGHPYAFFEVYSTNPWLFPAGQPVYATDTDTAIYVISRVAGENADRDAGENDYLLSQQEVQDLHDLGNYYKQVIVLVNAGGVMDLSFLDDVPAVKALLVVSQPGMEGGNAIADVLTGKANPSGKLTDTWARHYTDYSNAATFSHMNGNVETETYNEGIYVGYRYFDTFGMPVRFGFGYGLSYTTFQLNNQTVTADPQGTVTVTVDVTNTGAVSGKEVVQVYAALPDGRIEKEARRLVAFAKTKLLPAGETETVTLTFTPAQLESFDAENSCWVLEKGVYGICVGTSLSQANLCAALMLSNDKVLAQLEHICPVQDELSLLHESLEARAARYEGLLEEAKRVPQIAYDLSSVATHVVDYTITDTEDEASAIAKELTVDQMILLATGDPGRAQGSELGSAGATVPGSAAQTSSCAEAQGVPSLVLADGPAGLRLAQTYQAKDGHAVQPPMELSIEHGLFYDGREKPVGETYYQYCSAIPVGTMLAQTWNMPLLEKVGSIVGEEMEIFGVQLWLAPGMNIHRNPLCGRNFEYFAEDPLISGKCAAAITRGVQSHPGVGTTIKHYACNNQEDNRMGSNTVIDEKTLREIYLKGFEIAIQESQPMSLMTSYNLINGVHTANSYDLCTKAARCEFGFAGAIMTDWTTTNVDEKCTASGCMRAGNDMVMPGMPMDHENLRNELAAGTLTLAELRRCVTRTIRCTLNSNCFD